MGVLTGLKPQKVFDYFELLSSVPHGSGNTKAISDICADFAKAHGLRYIQDAVNNIVIYAPASAGREAEPSIILQGHLDMVCAKEADDPRDMSLVPIKLKTDKEFVWAENTSLGGDNAIAVAMVLALLDSPELSHPALEAVFTVDEETGMDGAMALDAGLLSSKRMINLDSEAEGIFTCGCAGGVRVNCQVPLSRCRLDSQDYQPLRISICGLLGGHSGAEIHTGRPNANVLLAEALYGLAKELPLYLSEFEGGHFDNAITDKSFALIYVAKEDISRLQGLVAEMDAGYKSRYAEIDPGVKIDLETVTADPDQTVNDYESSKAALYTLKTAPYGVQSMSKDIKGLVETSLNPGIAKLVKGDADSFTYSYSVRSSIKAQKDELVDKLKSILESKGGSISTHSEYPGWQYAVQSPLRDHCVNVYKELTGKDSKVIAIHAGLECGLFMEKLPGLDCISFGPDLYDIHSVREKLSVASTERLWNFVVALLTKAF